MLLNFEKIWNFKHNSEWIISNNSDNNNDNSEGCVFRNISNNLEILMNVDDKDPESSDKYRGLNLLVKCKLSIGYNQ